MNNSYYRYKDIELWDSESWKEKGSPVTPLAQYIEKLNHERERKREKTVIPDGLAAEPRTKAVVYPGFLDYWGQRNMRYSCNTMMDVRWIAMLPEKSGRTEDFDLLLVLHDADGFDPAWAMDTMERYKDYNEYIAGRQMMALYVATDGFDPENMYIRIMQEAAALFHVGYRKVFLDISTLVKYQIRLEQVPGFEETAGETGTIEKLEGLPAALLDITDTWADQFSLVQTLVAEDRYSNIKFDRERFIHSEMGERLAEGLRLEYDIQDSDDPRVKVFFQEKGLCYEHHETKGERWVTFVPMSAQKTGSGKLPVVVLFQEVNHRANRHAAMTAFSYFYQFTKIAAQGDCMLLFFALETPEDNDLLEEILAEAEEEYPMDASRVYLAGHSHNGHYALAYARRHHEKVAAVVTMGDDVGLSAPQYIGTYFQIDDEELERMNTYDMPMMNLTGETEHACFTPVNEDGKDFREGYKNNLLPFERRAEAWQRRLRACNCPPKTLEEIAATRESKDYVERKLGIPADKTECLYMDGAEYYIADVKNRAGNYHLRIAASGNTPHVVNAAMITLSWSFLRRFARNLSTGDAIELF